MNYKKYIITAFLLIVSASAFSQGKKTIEKSGNPIFPGWYADPEAHIFDNTYWVYPTYSDDYKNVGPKQNLSEHQKEIQKKYH